MKIKVVLLVFFALLNTKGFSQILSQKANELVQNKDENLYSFAVIFKHQPDFESLHAEFIQNKTELSKRPKLVIEYGMKEAEATQSQFKNWLEANAKKDVQLFDFYWVVNACKVITNASGLEKLKNCYLVEHIALNNEYYVMMDEPVEITPSKESINSHEIGLAVIKSTEMWKRGYTGRMRRALTFDTGAWTEHPAIADHYLGKYFPTDHVFFPFDQKTPGDKPNSHGTHVTGTMMGLERANNDTIGSAIEAYFLFTDPIVSNAADIKEFTEIFRVTQWILNPDGDINTSSDVPDVMNNSWGRSGVPDSLVCQGFMVSGFNAMEAAGIAVVFSAGNNGPLPQTIGQPSIINTNLVNIFSVGAVDGSNSNYPIAGFSSNGPTTCPAVGSLAIKPEVSAPGVNVRSAIGGNSYSNFSGTSMASPHVCGAILLLKEAFPTVSGYDILLALYNSARDLGPVGEDNTYGMGLINVDSAFKLLESRFTAVLPNVNGPDVKIVDVLNVPKGFVCDGIFSGSLSPKVVVKNQGLTTVNGLSVSFFDYSNNATTSFTFSGKSIAAGASDTIQLPAFSLTGNAVHRELLFKVNLLNPALEKDTINNRFMHRMSVFPKSGNNFSENFEGKNIYRSANWYIDNPDASISWDTLSVFNTTGKQSAAIKLNRYTNGKGLFDGMIVARQYEFDATNVPVELRFSYSYKFRHNLLTDTFYVLASDDCGLTFRHLIFKKGGAELSTTQLTSAGDYFPLSAADWKDTILDISNLRTSGKIILKFMSRCNTGNTLFVDDIQIYKRYPLSIESSTQNIKCFPIPSKGLLNIENSNFQYGNYTLSVYSLNGKEVLKQKVYVGSSLLQVDINVLSSGMYMIQLVGNNQNFTSRIIKE